VNREAPHAYLIVSHVNPGQVVRLVRALRRGSPHATILLHHDAAATKLSDDAFAGDAGILVDREPLRVEWAEFSLVDAVLRGVRRLFASGRAFSHLTLLSGQDFPLIAPAAFERRAAAGDGALAYEPRTPEVRRYVLGWHRLPRRLEARGGEALFTRLAWRLNGRQPLAHFVHGRIGCRVGLRSARSPFARGGLRAYKGSTWWTLSRRALEYVLDVVARDRALVDWYRRRTFMPDESIFQTILYNAGRFALRNAEERYVRWPDPHASSPATLRACDVPAALASGEPFARKFDERVEATALDRLEAVLR
jgi:hypothetical protein